MLERIDLEKAVDSLKEHIDDKFDAQDKYYKEVHKNFEVRLKKSEATVFGNGTDGLKERMTKVETRYATVRKMLLWAGGIVVSGLGLVGIKINL